MKTRIYQHIYTSHPKDGYGTLACHPVIREFDGELAGQGAYTRPASAPRKASPNQYPIQYKLYWLDNGTDRYRVFARSQYLGDDFHSAPPRPGNYISQSWVIPKSMLDKVVPYAVFKEMDLSIESGNITNRKAFIKYVLQTLCAHPVIEIDFTNRPVPFQQGPKAQIEFESVFSVFKDDLEKQKIFLFLIDQLINNTPKGFAKRPLIADNSSGLDDWFFAFLSAFPPQLMNDLVLTSYTNHPGNAKSLITGIIRSEALRTEFGANNPTYKWLEAASATKERKPENLYTQILQAAINRLDHQQFQGLFDDVIEDSSIKKIDRRINEPLTFRRILNNIEELCDHTAEQLSSKISQFKDDRRQSLLEDAIQRHCPGAFYRFLVLKLQRNSTDLRSAYHYFVKSLKEHILIDTEVANGFADRYIKLYIQQFFITNFREKRNIITELEQSHIAFKLLKDEDLQQYLPLIERSSNWCEIFEELLTVSCNRFSDIAYITSAPQKVHIEFSYWKKMVDIAHSYNSEQFTDIISPSAEQSIAEIENILVYRNGDVLERLEFLVELLEEKKTVEDKKRLSSMKTFTSVIEKGNAPKINWQDSMLRSEEGKSVLTKFKSLQEIRKELNSDVRDEIISFRTAIGYDIRIINDILDIVDIQDYNGILHYYNQRISQRKDEIGKKNVTKRILYDFQEGMTPIEWDTLRDILKHAIKSMGPAEVHKFLVKYLMKIDFNLKKTSSSTLKDKKYPGSLPRVIRLLEDFYLTPELPALSGLQFTFVENYMQHLARREDIQNLRERSVLREVAFKLIATTGTKLNKDVLKNLSIFIDELLLDSNSPYQAGEIVIIRNRAKEILGSEGFKVVEIPEIEFIDEFEKVPYKQYRAEHYTIIMDVLKTIRKKKIDNPKEILLKSGIRNVFLKPFTMFHWDLLLNMLQDEKWKPEDIVILLVNLFKSTPKKPLEGHMVDEVLMRDLVALLCIRKAYRDLLNCLITELEDIGAPRKWKKAIQKSETLVKEYGVDLTSWDELNSKFSRWW